METCKVCHNNIDNKIFVAREMMFGYREEFEYIECSKCGCLQMKNIPENLSKYYPDNYYSYEKKIYPRQNYFKRIISYKKASYFLYGKSLLGMVAAKLGRVPSRLKIIKQAELDFSSEMLDVGCGSGAFLLKLGQDGFQNLTGLDPYIKNNIYYENGINIYKKTLEEMNGQFDFILLSHSFEHMNQPFEALQEIYRLLKPRRHALIRIPVAAYAWQKYDVNWVQLDAPRHLFLHTAKSMRILAGKAGFEIKDIVYDSTEFQFLASEEYLKGIPLLDKNFYRNKKKSRKIKRKIKHYKRMADELNMKQDGDQASFYLYKE